MATFSNLPVETGSLLLNFLLTSDLWEARATNRAFYRLVWELMKKRPVTLIEEHLAQQLSAAGWKRLTFLAFADDRKKYPPVYRLQLRPKHPNQRFFCRPQDSKHLILENLQIHKFRISYSEVRFSHCHLPLLLKGTQQDSRIFLDACSWNNFNLENFRHLQFECQNMKSEAVRFYRCQKVSATAGFYLFEKVSEVQLTGRTRIYKFNKVRSLICDKFPNFHCPPPISLKHLTCPVLKAEDWTTLNEQTLESLHTRISSFHHLKKNLLQVKHLTLELDEPFPESSICAHFSPSLRWTTRAPGKAG